VKGWRGALLWFKVRSCGSRCIVVVVGGRRPFGSSDVGRDWVGQRHELDGSSVRSRTDCIFKAEESEERGRMLLLYGLLGFSLSQQYTKVHVQ